MISKIEQETIICFNEDEKTASVYTYNKKLKRHFSECCASFPDLVKLVRENEFGGAEFEVSKKHLSVRIKKPISDEQRIKLQNRARNINFGRQTKQNCGET